MADDQKGLGSDNMDPELKHEIQSKGGRASAESRSQGEKGGQSQGSSQNDNPGNFANRPQEEVEEAARKGGEN